MNHRRLIFRIIVGATLLCSFAADAQQGVNPANDEALNIIRNQPLRPDDNRIFDKWIEAELAALRAVANDPVLGAQAAQDFVDHCKAQFTNAANSAEFNERFVERCTHTFVGLLNNGAPTSVVATAMVRVLVEFKSVQVMEALFAALNSKHESVRYLAAKGIADLKADVQGNADVVPQTIQRLGEACAKEINGVVAAQLYSAMQFEQQPVPTATAMLTALQGRVELKRSPGAKIDRAELAAIDYFRQSPPTDQKVKSDLVGSLATLLRLCVDHLVAGKMSAYEQAAAEETVKDGEALLTNLVGGQGLPNVSRKMESGGAGRGADMQIELLLWIGTEGVPGKLNEAPWNVSIGAP